MLQSAPQLKTSPLLKEIFAHIAPADLDENLKQVKDRLEKQVDNPENWNLLGATFANKGSAFMEKAIKCFSHAVSMQPQNSEFVVNLLLAQARIAKDLQKAFDFFIAATRFDVSDKSKACIWLNIAHALEKTDLHAHLAFHSCNYANRLDKTNVKAWQTLANYYKNGYGCKTNKARAENCLFKAKAVQNKQPIKEFDKITIVENGIEQTIYHGNVPKPKIEHLGTPVPAAAEIPELAAAKPQALLPSLASLLMPPPPSVQGKPAAKRAHQEGKSELDLLREEIKLKQHRIDMMEAEMKNKDAQLEALREQLAQESRPTGRRSPR